MDRSAGVQQLNGRYHSRANLCKGKTRQHTSTSPGARVPDSPLQKNDRMNLLTRAARMARVDGATFFSAASKIWTALASFVSLALIVRTMSAESQGFYYTFSSLLSLQVLLELGFSYVIVQIAAHEFAISRKHVDPAARGVAHARLIMLLRLALRWYAVIAIAFWIGCSAAGECFFRATYPGDVSRWEHAWLLAVALFALCILVIPVYAILDGCNEIAAVAKTRMTQDVFGYGMFWLLLASGKGLYSVPGLYLGKIVGAAVGLMLTGLGKRLKGMLREPIAAGSPISWKEEIFPFQWKIALSWVSGYLIFQLFSPVLFSVQGAKVAGQAGMTIAFYSGINAVMLTWVSSKAPLFCELVALKRWTDLSVLFRHTVLASTLIIAIGLAAFTAIVASARGYFPGLSDRVLDNGSLICFALVSLANHYIFSVAVYVRAFKEEPFLIPSIVGAILTAAAVVGLARYSAFAVALGYCLITILVSLPWAMRIFLVRRKSLGAAAA